MKRLTLAVLKREETGKGPSGRLRKQGFIPAVVYGKSGVEHLKVALDAFRTLVREIGDRAALVELSVDGKAKVLSLLQEAKRNFQTDRFEHIDFKEISENEEMYATLPIHLKGEAYGVKNENGVIEFTNHAVEVRCLPKDLPDAIEVDISDLKVGQAIHVKNLPQIKGVRYTQKDIVIVSCSEIAEEEEEKAVTAEGASASATEGSATSPSSTAASAS